MRGNRNRTGDRENSQDGELKRRVRAGCKGGEEDPTRGETLV